MPELPDLTVYREHLETRIRGKRLEDIRIANPFLLRSVRPGIGEVVGHTVTACSRLAKQLVIELDGDYFVVVHLMIAGRLQWRPVQAAVPKRLGDCRHTLKRALTDQRVLAGIGNAYSDEILHAARLSPFKLASALNDDELARLHRACVQVLTSWTNRLREDAGDRFPAKVTAFHPQMAVHGRYRKPCPDCGSPVQRIRYAENEANYCARCQTGGRLLADRALSRLLKDNWPKRLEDLE